MEIVSGLSMKNNEESNMCSYNVNNPQQSKKSTFKDYFQNSLFFLFRCILHICKHRLLGGG